MTTMIGERIANKYEVLAEQGRGSFGEVYRALQHPVDRVVAVKTLNAAHLTDKVNRVRFLREARALARIDHPGIVTLHDFGDHAGRMYLVTEYIEGQTLQTLLRRQAPFSVERTLRLAARILDALAAAHAAQVIHRDLKPANIMVFRDQDDVEHVKLIDFGIASTATEPDSRREMVGTPRYMAPEQMTSGATEQSDLYGLAALLYEMLTGRPVFGGKQVLDVLRAHRHAHPQPMDPLLAIPDDVEALVLAALAKEPTARPVNASAMLAAVRGCLHRIVTAAPTPVSAPAPSASEGNAGGAGAPPLYLLPPIESDADADATDLDADADPINPLAATATHGVTGPLPPVVTPLISVDMHDGESSSVWSPVQRGSGPLPALIVTGDQTRSMRPAGATAGETYRFTLVAAACDPKPCWRRRCFWALVGLNAVAFLLGTL